ncbi:hypothetical protein HPB47_026080 [Ixodes persulcatus]|uniref:Uncharacterized protein n=1 Tax=Ixodes persulcatus TaxID=34615 RepID=A0AC60Q032_IXOPE|nr:hypothetical protein HPB47_026080 [Ixodes persulcatus]
MVVVTCEDRLELTMTNLKSAIAFSRTPLRLILYADEENIKTRRMGSSDKTFRASEEVVSATDRHHGEGFTARGNAADTIAIEMECDSRVHPRRRRSAFSRQLTHIKSTRDGRDSAQAAGQRESQRQGEHLSTTEVPDGFTIVNGRRRTKPTVGTGKASKVGVVSRPRKAALFVSRLAPDTTASDVILLVEPLLNGNPICCSKMKTKHETYSSFHVEVNQDSFEVINRPEVWPDGCIFHPFFGRLDVSRTSSSENNHAKMNDGDI